MHNWCADVLYRFRKRPVQEILKDFVNIVNEEPYTSERIRWVEAQTDILEERDDEYAVTAGELALSIVRGGISKLHIPNKLLMLCACVYDVCAVVSEGCERVCSCCWLFVIVCVLTAK